MPPRGVVLTLIAALRGAAADSSIKPKSKTERVFVYNMC